MSKTEIMELWTLRDRKYLAKKYLKPAIITLKNKIKVSFIGTI